MPEVADESRIPCDSRSRRGRRLHGRNSRRGNISTSLQRRARMMRPRSAAPIFMFLPDTRKAMDQASTCGQKRASRPCPSPPRPNRFSLGMFRQRSMRPCRQTAAACLSRRRWTEDGMRIASRYLATVRRAMSTPASRRSSTIVSSDRIASALLVLDQRLRMRWRTASAEWASPPAGRRDRRGEEVLHLEDAARRRHVLVGGDAR